MSDDLIRRSDAIKAIDRMKHRLIGNGCTYEFMRQMIEELPTIEAVPKDFHDKTCEAMAKRHTEEIQRLMPKRGEWVDDEFVGQYRCSECDYYAIDEYDFCPNCGADMREREGE